MGFGYGNRYYIAAGFAILVSITALLMRLLLPESPAFLALKGMTQYSFITSNSSTNLAIALKVLLKVVVLI